MNLSKKLIRKIINLRLSPIKVLLFHQVSDSFDENSMWKCDWSNTLSFKAKVLHYIQEGYTFISLQDAYSHITKDLYRIKKYAVLTSDDGWKSLLNILPWLAEHKIPITLFLNPMYMDGKHIRSKENERYLTLEDVKTIVEKYSSLVTIASHGWSHKDSLEMDLEEFTDSVLRSENYLSAIPNKIPFFAFTYGKYNKEELDICIQYGLVPVFVDDQDNYNSSTQIHRIWIDDGRNDAKSNS